MKRTVIISAAIASLTLSACAQGPTVLEEAYETCESPDHIEIRDEGKTIIMSGEGNESEGADIVDIACVLMALETPDRVINKIDSTRALDGTVSESWDGLKADWSYHPDSGLNMIVYLDESS